MEQDYDSDLHILEEEELADPANLERQNLFGCGGKDIFEQDAPAPSPQPSIYGMSQLLADINAPTPEDYPEDIPPHSPSTEAALQPGNLDWNEEVEWEAPSFPVREEEVVEVRHYQDPCLPSLWGTPGRGSSRNLTSPSLVTFGSVSRRWNARLAI